MRVRVGLEVLGISVPLGDDARARAVADVGEDASETGGADLASGDDGRGWEVMGGVMGGDKGIGRRIASESGGADLASPAGHDGSVRVAGHLGRVRDVGVGLGGVFIRVSGPMRAAGHVRGRAWGRAWVGAKVDGCERDVGDGRGGEERALVR